MLKFLTSFTFLYAYVITILIVYGISYYKSFARNGQQRKSFPLVFLLVGAACFSFLYFNIHASLQLRTFTNLDHHFISHKGFKVGSSIELGRNDTVNYKTNAYNSFVLQKKNNQVLLSSAYSEEPFYVSNKNRYAIATKNYPATGHLVSIRIENATISVSNPHPDQFSLQINETNFHSLKPIRKGLSAWNLFRDDTAFMNSSWYTNENLINCLKDILLLRDEVSKDKGGDLKYFLSGRLFRKSLTVSYDQAALSLKSEAISYPIPDRSSIAWGMGFLDNNRNQFNVKYLGADSFELVNKYPVSYPLTEEKNQDPKESWTSHDVNKFLVSDSKDMLALPSVFKEGFLFSPFPGDSTMDFQPVSLNYQLDEGQAPLALQVRSLAEARPLNSIQGNELLLPAKAAGFSWAFSIKDSFEWKIGSRTMPAKTWQVWIFGTLLFFFLLIFATGMLKPASKLSWIWQLLTMITLVLLTTRFFLYWRYKSFPPYESLDLPSLQQLNSFWNFGIILVATILLAVIFGYGTLKYLYSMIARKSSKLLNLPSRRNQNEKIINEELLINSMNKLPFIRRINAKTIFFTAWILVLLSGGAIAALNDFDPSVCRHLAIALILFYFLFLYISYKHSPLVVSSGKSWWELRTGKHTDIIINNPVKVLLSVSLLGLFAFVDMGFAIIFLNFLLFNEAFLCINYAIAGLSAGSKKNATVFGIMATFYLSLFVINLLFGPWIFKWILDLPPVLYTVGYVGFALLVSYMISKLLHRWSSRKRILMGVVSFASLFMITWLFFPKERILEKAAITQYRIDVMTMPVDQSIEKAYADGKTYEPVIRAAQNQWFINTFIYEKNNPLVNTPGFHLMPHAPQNKGARYNAQATDLVTSRFLLAEHGRWAVLFYMLLLLLPAVLLASFYKLYPDFTNRINNNYPTITTGFSLLNYLLVTALLVILAATGRYIFFGQDLPFGSILSKQSILFPAALIVIIVLLFKNIPLERYSNRKKFVPGVILFAGLSLLLFFVKPCYNKNREFAVEDLAREMDNYIQLRIQPILDEIDTSKSTRKLSLSKKDRLFADAIMKLNAGGGLFDASKFFTREMELYARGGFTRHLDQSRMLFLDLNSGHPQLAINDNYFRVEPPPHLQQAWKGNVFSDTSNYNISVWNATDGSVITKRISSYTPERNSILSNGWQLVFRHEMGNDLYDQLCFVVNTDTIALRNPGRITITDPTDGKKKILISEPDAFMKNYFVNGSRYYVYPMGADFNWARNFSETISSTYAGQQAYNKNVFISPDRELMDSLSVKMRQFIDADTSYKNGAEYGICIADGEGRLIAMPDLIKGMARPDPNDKAGFAKAVRGENGIISQSLLRKAIGNVNLLRMNPGPGSTLKPIVFSAIASQLAMDWNAFAAEGFSTRQQLFGGEKVAEYDFEKNNGRIGSVADYLKYSDNYYYADLLLLGSYNKQDLRTLLAKHFARQNPESGLHWPYFSYNGQQYWLDGFENWPGYENGKANFGSDSSFLSVGLFNNYGIFTYAKGRGSEKFNSSYDSLLFKDAYKKSGFILPEYALFDQKGTGMDLSKPNEVFLSSFRGHVKGSSQVRIPPVKMLDAFGKLASQNRNYSLTLNPYATGKTFQPFLVDNSVGYAAYLSLIRESVFTGMREALSGGTAARLGSMMKNEKAFYYYAKTGTTGDEESKLKSKLFAIVISEKDIADPGFSFRNNKFYTIYFTSQKGPAKQNEEFQAAVIKMVMRSAVFNRYMKNSREGGEAVRFR